MKESHKGHPIMWRVKIQEGKDCLKKAAGTWVFPSNFQGYTKTATLMPEMTKPTHHTGDVVSMDSVFYVSVDIIVMHNHGAYGQALSKKHKY